MMLIKKLLVKSIKKCQWSKQTWSVDE